MAGYLHNDVFDSGLSVLDTATTTLYICSQQPTTLGEATTTYALGNKASPSISAPSDAASGRKVTVSAITGGSVTASATATHWAVVDATRLLATNNLAASQAVTSGNTFSLASFDISIPDPV